jgi:sporulation protein YlmC with PRC-barrel domain
MPFQSQLAFSDLTTALTARQPNSVPKHPNWLVHRQLATKICGLAVENRDGQHVGQVQDFIIDVHSGEVRYVVISFGGWLGLGRKLRAVPSAMVSTATAKAGVVALDVGRRRWDQAPLFAISDLKRMRNDPEASEALSRYYGQSSLPIYAAHRVNRSSVIQVPANSTDPPRHEPASSSASPQQPSLEFVTQLLTKAILDRRGEKLGELSDLLVDLTGTRPTLAIILASEPLGKSDQFAVSLCSLKPQQSGALRIEALAGDFENAPKLDDSKWHKAFGPAPDVIFRFPLEERQSSGLEIRELEQKGTLRSRRSGLVISSQKANQNH